MAPTPLVEAALEKLPGEVSCLESQQKSPADSMVSELQCEQ